MRVLCVAEKPSIAKAISQILSGGQFNTTNTRNKFIKNYEFDYPQTQSFFTVTCVSGHLTAHDFYDTHRKWHACDAFDLFDAPVETKIPPDNKDIENNLMAQARRAQVLMIWTDCDREGEHIGMEIAKVCRKANATIRIKRARFSAIIAQQIHNAAQHPVELDTRQADAVEARIMLDLKVGSAFTRLQTLILQGRVPQIANEKSVVSYGPCQFPTLGFVVQRYSLVKNFTPEPFWYIYLSLTRPTHSQGREEETKFNWKRNHIFDEVVVMNLFARMGNSLAVVTKVANKTTKKWKPLPLTTVELQKAGSRLLRLAPKKVLDVAEKLYQQGFVSYPRTETDEFDKDFDHMSLIGKQTADPSWGAFATSLQQGGFNTPRKGKNNDKAHPPIHPTAHAGNLAGDEKRVYEYITRRYLGCCSKDAEGWQTTVDVVCGGEEFYATGLVVKERNYLNVFIYDKWTGHTVPDFQEGEEFQPTVCEIRQGETSKPNYLTEADLVTLMDKNGIGTDATIAQHIQTIIDRDYVIERMEGATKYLVPSTLGIGLIEGYNQIGLAKNVSKPQLRRETERKMVQVCEGTVTKHDMLHQGLNQYKEMFVIVRREFQRVTSSVTRYLAGEGNAQNNHNGNGHGPGGGGGGGGGGNGGGGNGGGGNGGDDEGGGGGNPSARGRGAARGRAARGTRGAAATTRGRGRGRAPSSAEFVTIDSDDDDDFATPNTGRTATTATSSLQSGPSRTIIPTIIPLIPQPVYSSTSSTAVGSSSRQTAPLYMSPTWQAGPPPAAASTSSARPPPPPPRADYNRSNSMTDDGIKCRCDVPAGQRTVTADTASKGRKFWTCDTRTCDFFQWVDEGVASVPAKRPYSTTNNDGGEARQCNCKEDGIMLTTQKEGPNKGRKFWKCRKLADQTPCTFFEWDDEPPRTSSGPVGRSGGATPSFNSGGASGSCYKCGEEGHFANVCPGGQGDSSGSKRSRSFGAGANDKAAGAECYKCHQVGHFSSSCPNGASTASSKYSKSKSFGNAASTDECYKCGQQGHWSTNCPQDGGGSSYTKKSYSSGSTSGKRGRGGSTSRGTSKRGRGAKKSKFGAADEY